MNAIKRYENWGIFGFLTLTLLVFFFSLPFLKPIPLFWSQMNVYLQTAVFLLAAAYFLHASFSLSLANALRLLGSAVSFAYAAEYAGMHWPGIFGSQYSYDSALWPFLPGGVPVIVVLMWFVLAYTALKFIHPLFIETSSISFRWRWLLKGGVCALYMTAMDFFIDPLGTHAGLWLWKEPGDYFDTPWANFSGWFLVGWMICSVYLFFERPVTPVGSGKVRRLDGLFPPISIFLTILCFIGSVIHLRSVLPAFLSLAVLGPCWWFWLASTRLRQSQ